MDYSALMYFFIIALKYFLSQLLSPLKLCVLDECLTSAGPILDPALGDIQFPYFQQLLLY